MILDKCFKYGDNMIKDDLIKEEIVGNVGVIYLNRPEKINALNFQMIIKLRNILEKWEKDKRVKAILFDSKSEKGFCSGGDLKELYYDFVNNFDCDKKDGFFSKEFSLDKYIANYKKPVVSHWYGVVMGGGIGLSINSDLIICEENVNWAMPETGLGFVPDVGVCHYISKLPKALGQYVGLCGASLESYDLIKYNLADVCVNSKDYKNIVEKLFEFSEIYNGEELIEKVKKEAEKYAVESEKSFLDKHMENIEKHFSHSSLKEIFENLEKNLEDKFLQESFENLKKKDPFMLATQFEKYFVCKSLTYEETLNLDLKVLNYAVDTRSMNEGIKSKIIEKGYEPKRKCKSLDDVSLEKVKKLLKVEETYRERKD